MSVTVGVAPDSWGVWFPSDPKQTPWHRFLDEVAAAGYEWIELGPYGYLPTDLPTLRAELERRGLKVAGSAVAGKLEEPSDWPALEQQVLGAGELLAALGAQFLVLIDDPYSDPFTGAPTAPVRLDDEAWKQLIATTHRIADLARSRFGLTIAFHPHADSHVQDESQIETFLADTDPSRVSLCLDIGHHAYCGGDPVAFIRKHHDRIPYLHLKSLSRELLQKVVAENIPLGTAVQMGTFCEPALGMINFLAFRDVLREVGYSGFGIVEQDMYPVPFDKPLPIARRTRAYLREIGIG